MIIYPFIVTPDAVPDPEGTDEAIIRGVVCTRVVLKVPANVYKNGEKVEEEIIYWKPVAGGDTIARGLELMEKGLGFTD